MNSTDIKAYNEAQTGDSRQICDKLSQLIDHYLAATEAKVWHGHPVWFINGNPITGYAVRKDNVQLLFWSGQSFNEPLLKAEGSFKAAEIRFDDADDINDDELKKWLKKGEAIQWDYKNIVKRKGVLERLK